jgi:McbB family protein
MTKHLILPFKLLEPEDGIYLVVSQTGYAQLNPGPLGAAVQQLDEMGCGTLIDASKLQDVFRDFPHSSRVSAHKYLLEISILREVNDDFGRFASIRLIHESNLPIASLGTDLEYMTGIPCITTGNADSVKENELAVLYTPTHDVSLILTAQRAVNRLQNSPLLVAYLRGRALVLDGLFIPAAKTPCHFCQSSALMASNREAVEQPPGWLSSVHAMTVKQSIVGMQYRIVTSDHWFCAAILRNRIREIVGPNPEPINCRMVLDRWELSLEGFQARREMTDALIECEFCQA